MLGFFKVDLYPPATSYQRTSYRWSTISWILTILVALISLTALAGALAGVLLAIVAGVLLGFMRGVRVVKIASVAPCLTIGHSWLVTDLEVDGELEVDGIWDVGAEFYM